MNITENKFKISIDLMGGDNSPDKTVQGIDLFVKRNKHINDYFFIYMEISQSFLQK